MHRETRIRSMWLFMLLGDQEALARVPGCSGAWNPRLASFWQGLTITPGHVLPERDASGEDQVGGLWIELVFQGENARSQRFGGVILFDGHPDVQQAGPPIEVRSHEVHGRPGVVVAGLDGALMGVESGILWQQ